MAKRGPNHKQRVPEFCFTTTEGISYYVTYRDPRTNSPRKHRFRIKEKSWIKDAQIAYDKWLGDCLESGPPKPARRPIAGEKQKTPDVPTVPANSVPGSVLEVAFGFLDSLEARIRKDSAPRT